VTSKLNERITKHMKRRISDKHSRAKD